MKLYPDVFLEFAETSGRLRTKASRESFGHVARQLQATHPSQRITQFTTEQLTKFCIGNGLAPNTQKHRMTVLRGIFDWATWKGYVKENPSSALKYTVSPGKFKVRQGKWLTKEQAAVVLRSCPDTLIGRRDKLILLFGFLMGLRRFEIAKLRWADLSPDGSEMFVLGKGNKPVQMGVPEQLQRELAEWRKEAPAGAKAIIPVTHVTGLVDTDPTVIVDWDSSLGDDGIYNVVRSAGERCELALAPHDMRRSFAGILEDDGIAVTDIQRAMRHTNVGITSGYLEQNPRRAAAVTKGLTIDY